MSVITVYLYCATPTVDCSIDVAFPL